MSSGEAPRCSVYVLYWYKSTNTDAAGGAQKQSKTEGVGSLTGSRERERGRERGEPQCRQCEAAAR